MSYLGLKIRHVVPNEIKQSKTLNAIKFRIKRRVPDGCPCRICKVCLGQVGFIITIKTVFNEEKLEYYHYHIFIICYKILVFQSFVVKCSIIPSGFILSTSNTYRFYIENCVSNNFPRTIGVQGVRLKKIFEIYSYRKHVFMGQKTQEEGGNRKKLHLTP